MPPEVILDNVVVEPAQIVVTPSICERTGSSLTVTLVTVLVAEQPLASVTVTVYSPAVEAVYVAPVPTVVVPLLHEYDVPSLADKTTLPPLQNVVADPAVIVAVGNGLIVRDVDTELVHPYIVKEYEIPRNPEYPILFAVTTPL